MNEISMRIDQAIKQVGLTYMELQKITGIPKSAIQRYATGATDRIPIDRIRAIAKATNTTAQWIMGWESEDDGVDEITKRLHEDPKLRMLFSKTSKMTDKDMDAMLSIASAILRERQE